MRWCGQEHITRTLKNQIIENRVGHAYLFNGGRGTGKTSAAKIMARAINCLNPKDGEPCNECEICKSILGGHLTDVVEMDAASNNSVENIRAIRDEVNFLPTLAKYRVYIIDEVHMLSTGAFNALLKTLEEPPEHVKFILATTEPQKLPATILSRCQRFDFKRISVDSIIQRLSIICKETNIEITEEAMKLIAILSEGALRDAIGLLERCIQDGQGKIEEDNVRELVGIPKLIYIRELVKNIIKYNTEEAIKVINEVIAEGKDLENFLWEIIKYIKDILVYKTTKELTLYNNDDLNFLKELSEEVEKERLLKLIYDFSELSNTMKWATQKNIILQAGIIKASMHIEETRIPVVEQNYTNAIPTQRIKKEEPKKIEPKVEAKKAEVKVPQGNYLPYWNQVLAKIKDNGKVILYTNLIGTKAVQIDDMTVGIEFSNKMTDFAKKTLEDLENKNLISKLVSMEAGNTMQIKYLSNGDVQSNQEKAESKIESIASKLDLPINIIDE